MKKKILLTLLIAAAVAGAYGIYLWNKPKRTASDEEAAASLTAAELYSSFATDATEANALYLDKVIEVRGTVSDIALNADGIATLTLETDDPMAAVMCTYAPDAANTATIGEQILLHGICSGMQGDLMPSVVLSQCSEPQ